MRLIAAPGVGLAPLRGRLNFPGHSLTLIAKVQLALAPGGVARVLTHEPAFPTGDQPYEDDALGLGLPRYASDFVFQKPAAEVLVVGHFHAPGQKPVRASEVSLSIDAASTRLSVIGRRRFLGSGPLPTANEAEPFNRLALRWEHAYGGPGHSHNPVGTGYLDAEGRSKTRGAAARNFAREPLELPRIEHPDLLFTHLDQMLEPLCFAPRAATWPVRRNLFGKCDDRWFKTRWPWFPEDCDPRYFMSALPALQQRDYLRGNETLRFKNMHAQHARYETRLPGLAAIGVVQRFHADGSGDVSTEAVPLKLDTLWVDMDHELAQLVFRGSVACRDADASDIRHAWVGLTPHTSALSAAEIEACGARAIADDEAGWEIVASTPLAPPPPEPLAERVEEPLDPQLRAILSQLKPEERELRPLTPKQQAVIAAATERAQAELTARLDSEEQAEAAKQPPPWTRERVQRERGTAGALRGLDLSGLDLSGEDLSGVDLTGALLRGTRLDQANLRAADLSGACLEGASLNAADLTHAKLEDADLSRCQGARVRAEGVKLARANLSECKLTELALREADLTLVLAKGAQLVGARFEACLLDEATLDGAQLTRATFTRCSLTGTRFVAAQLSAAVFVDCVLTEADFEQAELSEASLARCNLDDATLEEVRAKGLKLEASSVARLRAARADFSFAHWTDVSGADLICEGGSLAEARLERCHLPGADLSAVDLSHAYLSAALLIGAKFRKANLSNARLLGSDCFQVSFEAACLSRLDGSGSSFFRAEFLDADVLDFYGQMRDLTGTKLAPAEG